TGNRHPFIFSHTAETVVGRHTNIPIAHARQLGTIHGIFHPSFRHQSSHRFPQRHVDILALTSTLPCSQRSTDRGGSGDAAIRVTVRNTHFLWGTSSVAGQGGETRQRRDSRPITHVVSQRTSMTITGDRGHDDVGLDFLEFLIPQAQMFHYTSGEV